MLCELKRLQAANLFRLRKILMDADFIIIESQKEIMTEPYSITIGK